MLDSLQPAEMEKMKQRICRCCGLDPEMQQLGICCDTFELSDYGSGYIAFFSLTKLCFWLCVIFIGANVTKIIRNVNGSNCISSTDPDYDFLKKLPQACTRDWIATHAIANWGSSIDYVDKGIMLAYFALFYIILIFYYPYLKSLGDKIDKHNNVPSDWTVQVTWV
jgi:hypothetical protein